MALTKVDLACSSTQRNLEKVFYSTRVAGVAKRLREYTGLGIKYMLPVQVTYLYVYLYMWANVYICMCVGPTLCALHIQYFLFEFDFIFFRYLLSLYLGLCIVRDDGYKSCCRC